MRGVILAGGKATRMGLMARAAGKHVLPVGGEPMIRHSFRKLVGAGVKDILIITSPEQIGALASIIGSGADECRVSWRVQDEPGGIAQALALAEDFAHRERVVVVLGDNIWRDPLPIAMTNFAGTTAWVCLHKVSDAARYGVAVLEPTTRCIVKLAEKPAEPESDLAVCGIYSLPGDVFDVIRNQKPSARGELEIIDVLQYYLDKGRLEYSTLPGWWIDAGEPDALYEANFLVHEQPPQW